MMENKNKKNNVFTILKELGIDVKNEKLFLNAITHTSYANEHKVEALGKVESYERLEFLGDAILDFLVGEYLYLTYKDMPEGELTKIRSKYVCTPANAEYAIALKLDECLRLGKGERVQGGKKKPTVLADVFEAFLGAIYLDSGIDNVRKVMKKVVFDKIEYVDEGYFIDYKSKLQEDIQAEKDSHEVGYHYEDPCKSISIEEARQRIANGEKYTVRQTIPTTGITSFEDMVYGHIEVENAGLDEGVLLKSDGYPTYNFANIVDDHLMGISHVVRGNEYLSSTPKYNLIYKAFGWQDPIYVHVPPVMKDEFHKLSKRNGDASFQDLRAKGILSEAIINYIALLGWSPSGEQEIFSLEELTKEFSIDRITKSGSIFDTNKLIWMNGVYLRNKPVEEFHELALPYYKKCVTREVDLMELSKALHHRCEVLGEIPETYYNLEGITDPVEVVQ